MDSNEPLPQLLFWPQVTEVVKGCKSEAARLGPYMFAEWSSWGSSETVTHFWGGRLKI